MRQMARVKIDKQVMVIVSIFIGYHNSINSIIRYHRTTVPLETKKRLLICEKEIKLSPYLEDAAKPAIKVISATKIFVSMTDAVNC